ncbi:signal peptidase I [Photorhabdus asymbiotica]|uniref:signal peptidase I n=1 Tax=Photorhabdus asymbiotica TaxID=291112 RepID=UPI003DA6F038
MTGIPVLLVFLVILLIRDGFKRRKPQPWLTLSLSLCVCLLVSNRWFSAIYRVPTASMEPTLHPGDYVSGVRFNGLLDDGKIQRGDIVVFKAPVAPRTLYIKRVIGIPGDVIEFDKNKTYRVNGKPLGTLVKTVRQYSIYSATSDRSNAPYHFVIDNKTTYVPTKGLWQIPKDYYFMAGDNRDHSWDSRYWENPPGTPKHLRGLVPYERIEARFITSLFNFLPFSHYDTMNGAMQVVRKNVDEVISNDH